jgi:hypothetical protein
LLRGELLHAKELRTVTKTIEGLEAREDELKALLDEASDRSIKPLSDSFKDIKTLADLLDKAKDKDDIRIRLRAAIRRVVKEVWMLVVHQGRDQLASVQVFFREDKREEVYNVYRSFMLIHRPGRGNQHGRTPARYAYRTIAQPEGMEVGLPFDLHDLRQQGTGGEGWLGEGAVGADVVLGSLEDYPRYMIDRILKSDGCDLD